MQDQFLRGLVDNDPESPRLVHKDPQEVNPPEVVVAEDESEFFKLRRKGWARLISRVLLDDPSFCRSCQTFSLARTLMLGHFSRPSHQDTPGEACYLAGVSPIV